MYGGNPWLGRGVLGYSSVGLRPRNVPLYHSFAQQVAGTIPLRSGSPKLGRGSYGFGVRKSTWNPGSINGYSSGAPRIPSINTGHVGGGYDAGSFWLGLPFPGYGHDMLGSWLNDGGDNLSGDRWYENFYDTGDYYNEGYVGSGEYVGVTGPYNNGGYYRKAKY